MKLLGLLNSYFRKVYHSPRHLLIHILLLITIGYLKIESEHESTLFKNIVNVSRRDTKSLHDTVFIRHLMVSINKMMWDRNAIFRSTEDLSIKTRIFKSVDADLMYGAGSCGGFSKVFARALKTAGYYTRIGQMKVNGEFGGHVLLETYIPSLHKWVVLDPLFLLVFTNKDNKWASFEEVNKNWPFFKEQIENKLRIEYNYDYSYSGIRYTNWGKVPIVGNVVYKCLVILFGKDEADMISLRPYLLNQYRFYEWIFGSVYVCYFIYLFYIVVKNSRKEKNLKTIE